MLGALWQSRKFRAVIIDVTCSLILYGLAHLGTQATVDAAKELIAILQPVFVIFIAGVAYEDGQAKSSPKMVQAENVGTMSGDVVSSEPNK